MENTSKTWMLAISLLVLVVAIVSVHAQNDTNSTTNDTNVTLNQTNETENTTNQTNDDFDVNDTGHNLTDDDKNDIKVMCEPFGAQVRMLELQKQLQANILKGQNIVDLIDSGNYTLNSTNLTEKRDALDNILNKMEVLDEQIQSTNFTNTSHEQLATGFVDLKDEAIKLTKDFRDAVRSLLTPANANDFRNLLKDTSTRTEKIDDAVKQLKQEYNADHLASLLAAAGKQDDAFVQKARDGTVSAQDIKTYLTNLYKSMTPEQRKALVGQLKNDSDNQMSCVKGVGLKFVQGLAQRKAQKAKDWSKMLEKFSKMAQKGGFEQRAARLDNLSNVWQNRSDLFEGKAQQLEQWRNQLAQKLSNWTQKWNEKEDQWRAMLGNRTGNGTNLSGMKQRIQSGRR